MYNLESKETLGKLMLQPKNVLEEKIKSLRSFSPLREA